MPKYKKRSDGRYQANIYIGTENGKKKYKTVYAKGEKELDKKIREVKNQLDKGIDIISSSSTFEMCTQKWLKSIEKSLTPSQYNLYKYRIGVFTDVLGEQSIIKIKPDALQDVLNSIADKNPTTGKPSSNKTVLCYKEAVQMLYKYLVNNRYIEFDSTAVLTVPKTALPKEERRALTSEEQKWVKEFSHRAQLPAMIAMLCGLRRGEISALTWSDIDFDNKTITVSKSYDFKHNQVKLPKTKSGIRVVPIPDELIAFLRPLKGKSADLVVKNTQGRRLTECGWDKLWTAYMNDLNMKYGDIGDWKRTRHSQRPPMAIEQFTMHCLRHTYATILYDAGVDVMTAKELLDHSDVSTTMGIYTHLSAENKQYNIDKLNDFLNKSAG